MSPHQPLIEYPAQPKCSCPWCGHGAITVNTRALGTVNTRALGVVRSTDDFPEGNDTGEIAQTGEPT